MRISVRQLRRVIKEAILHENEMGIPAGEPGQVIEKEFPYFKSNPGLLVKIVNLICPGLFIGYDPSTGTASFYQPGKEEHEHWDSINRCLRILDVFDDTNSEIAKYAMRPHLY